jgi:hypothetical protein
MALLNVAQQSIFARQGFLAVRTFDCHGTQVWVELATPQVPLHIIFARERFRAAMNEHRALKPLFASFFMLHRSF